MALYSMNNTQAGSQQNLSSSYKTLCSLTAATGATTLRRGFIYEWEVGLDGAPNSTDCAVIWDWSRQTTLGTGTSNTPSPLDFNDAAALLVSTVNYTVEPTITASLMTVALNQRNSQRWIARDDRSALIVPATNVAGIAGRAKSPTYASTAVMTEFFSE
jgi:hypothetical protein